MARVRMFGMSANVVQQTAIIGTLYIVLVSLGLAAAFEPSPSRFRCRNARVSNSSPLFSLGNLVSGLTGIPPGKLLDASMQKKLVDRTSLEEKELECAYKASRDGWSAVNFHQCVDGKGSGLVVGLSRTGALFGGFNPLGWRSTDDYGTTNAAFLWFPQGSKVIKCPVYTGGNAAIFDYATGGPCFGADDLLIGPPRAAVMGGFAGPDMENTSVNAGNLKEAKSSLGTAYDFKSGWPVRGGFQLAELEVYCSKNVGASGGGGGRSWWAG